uniref:Ion transport protein n=1 Tax=Tetraselmis sp. GSL018 TaxID=582737 RepID=A0A061S3A6_9CHLO
MAFALQAANRQLLRDEGNHAHKDDHAERHENSKDVPEKPKAIIRMGSRGRFAEESRPKTMLDWPKYLFLKGAFYSNIVCLSPKFQHFITFVIVVASVLVGLQTYDSMSGSRAIAVLDSVVLYIFTFEVVVKVWACGNRPWEYFYHKSSVQYWNIFDFLVVVVCYLPLDASMVTVIRLFRLLRVLKLVKALPELQIIVMGLLSSLSSIFYVALLLMLVFYLYGIMCVSFFRDNDPVHFGSLETTFLTLFRMATFEDWTDVMYTQLYSCKVYGYGFREEWCTKPERPMGWAAAPFFVSFIILSSFVVLNLFIGVIISNMNDARTTLDKAEAEAEDGALDDFQRDSAVIKSMLTRMTELSSNIEKARDTMQDMQVEVQKLENSARVRKNKYRNGESKKTGWTRVMSDYKKAANRIKRGLAPSKVQKSSPVSNGTDSA